MGNRIGVLASAALTALIGSAWAQVSSEEESEDIFFHEHYQAALEEAKLTKKPIFLAFRCAP